MKVRVEIRQTIFYCGEVEMTKERYEKYKCIPMRNLVNSMMFIGLHKEEDDWDVEAFIKLGD